MITYEQALSTLKELVAERGEDFVYGSADGACIYSTVEGSPSCGVGYVFAKLDPPMFHAIHVAEWGEVADINNVHQFPVSEIEENLSIEYDTLYTRKAGKLLAQFQSAQDQKVPYGLALEDAISEAGWWEDDV
jgi:hypothetical protein